MYDKYKIKSLGSPFDGLVAHVSKDDRDNVRHGYAVSIVRLERKTNLFADNNFSEPLRSNSLYIRGDCLEQYEEYETEFDDKNMYGKLISQTETDVLSNGIVVTLYEYEKAMTVTAVMGDDIVFRGATYSEIVMSSMRSFVELLKIGPYGAYDADDVIFDLSRILKS